MVDADSCPVMDEIVRIASQFGIAVRFISDYSHSLSFDAPHVLVHLVDNAGQAVDIAIINTTVSGDIVITNDLGLASLCLNKGAIALSPSGTLYKSSTMDHVLERRHLQRKLRKAGVRLKGGPPSFTRKDRARFVRTLSNILNKLIPSSTQQSTDTES